MSERLEPLIGVWRGEGLAEYPTIEATRYKERTAFRRYNAERLFYDQVAWKESGVVLHQESGFIIDAGDNLKMVNWEEKGRTEVMTGTVVQDEDRLRLVVETIIFVSDPRLLSSRRIITVEKDQLTYVQWMTIRTYPSGALHLTASLTRAAV